MKTSATYLKATPQCDTIRTSLSFFSPYLQNLTSTFFAGALTKIKQTYSARAVPEYESFFQRKKRVYEYIIGCTEVLTCVVTDYVGTW